MAGFRKQQPPWPDLEPQDEDQAEQSQSNPTQIREESKAAVKDDDGQIQRGMETLSLVHTGSQSIHPSGLSTTHSTTDHKNPYNTSGDDQQSEARNLPNARQPLFHDDRLGLASTNTLANWRPLQPTRQDMGQDGEANVHQSAGGASKDENEDQSFARSMSEKHRHYRDSPNESSPDSSETKSDPSPTSSSGDEPVGPSAQALIDIEEQHHQGDGQHEPGATPVDFQLSILNALSTSVGLSGKCLIHMRNAARARFRSNANVAIGSMHAPKSPELSQSVEGDSGVHARSSQALTRPTHAAASPADSSDIVQQEPFDNGRDIGDIATGLINSTLPPLYLPTMKEICNTGPTRDVLIEALKQLMQFVVDKCQPRAAFTDRNFDDRRPDQYLAKWVIVHDDLKDKEAEMRAVPHMVLIFMVHEIIHDVVKITVCVVVSLVNRSQRSLR